MTKICEYFDPIAAAFTTTMGSVVRDNSGESWARHVRTYESNVRVTVDLNAAGTEIAVNVYNNGTKFAATVINAETEYPMQLINTLQLETLGLMYSSSWNCVMHGVSQAVKAFGNVACRQQLLSNVDSRKSGMSWMLRDDVALLVTMGEGESAATVKLYKINDRGEYVDSTVDIMLVDTMQQVTSEITTLIKMYLAAN